MKGLSSAQFLETLELGITDAGMSYIVHAPRLINLTLRKCKNVTDDGMAELVSSKKLEPLTVVGCCEISQEGVQGAAKSVRYSEEIESFDSLKGTNLSWSSYRRRRFLAGHRRKSSVAAVSLLLSASFLDCQLNIDIA
uniref:Uncharacterized protein n=2 Tax=Leersia perrieri TaxID=77586 RepID=A0A0D9VM81_9ORYZ